MLVRPLLLVNVPRNERVVTCDQLPDLTDRQIAVALGVDQRQDGCLLGRGQRLPVVRDPAGLLWPVHRAQ